MPIWAILGHFGLLGLPEMPVGHSGSCKAFPCPKPSPGRPAAKPLPIAPSQHHPVYQIEKSKKKSQKIFKNKKWVYNIQKLVLHRYKIKSGILGVFSHLKKSVSLPSPALSRTRMQVPGKIKSRWRRHGLKRCYKWSRGIKQRYKEKEDAHGCLRTPKIALPYYQAHTVYVRNDFCKCRFKRDKNKFSIPMENGLFLAPRMSHISS